MEGFLSRLLALREHQDDFDGDNVIIYRGEDGTIHGFIKEKDFQGTISYHPTKFYERVVLRKISKTNRGYLLQKQRQILLAQGFTVDVDSAYRSSAIPQ